MTMLKGNLLVVTKNLICSIASGIVSGAVLAVVANYRDEHADAPSLLEKAQAWESKLYQDGAERADLIEKIKQDARLAAKK